MSDILVPVTEILLTQSQYLKEMNDSNIKSATFIPPRIGSNNYGYFKVTYKLPVLKKEHSNANFFEYD